MTDSYTSLSEDPAVIPVFQTLFLESQVAIYDYPSLRNRQTGKKWEDLQSVEAACPLDWQNISWKVNLLLITVVILILK